MDYLSVKSTEKKSKAEKVDCGKSGGERNLLFFSICVLLPALKKEQFSKAGRREEQIKATLVEKAGKLQAKVLK